MLESLAVFAAAWLDKPYDRPVAIAAPLYVERPLATAAPACTLQESDEILFAGCGGFF